MGAVDYDVAECDLDWLISALVGRRDGVEVMEQVRRLKLKDRVGIEVRKGGIEHGPRQSRQWPFQLCAASRRLV